MELNEIKHSDKITYENFLQRLPLFIREAFVENVEKDSYFFKDFNKKDAFFKELHSIYSWNERSFAWGSCKKLPYIWSVLETSLIKLMLHAVTAQFSCIILLEEYIMHGKELQKFIKEIEEQDVFIESLDFIKIEFLF